MDAIGIPMGGPIGIPMAHQKTNGPWEFQWGDPIAITMGLSEKSIGNPMGGVNEQTLKMTQLKVFNLKL